jgi:ABC-2 type transport system ATP-binding protein
LTDELLVDATDLVKEFDGVRALDGLGLQIKRGIFGLIGPNGAGKTTFLRVILGLIRPDSGYATVMGFDTQKQSLEIRRKVGVLHEKPVFPGAMTCIKYLRRVSGLYDHARSPDELLSAVGLISASTRKIRHLSAGMYQRLGIAQALVGSPQLAFLDEPTSNLDVSGRDDIIQLLVDIHHELGVSFVISSHILSELEKACHEVAFIQSGKIVEAGRTQDLIKKYAVNRFKIVSSDPRTLEKGLSDLTGIADATITGVSSITIVVETEHMDIFEEKIRQLASSLGVEIHAIHKAASLEDTYREVIGIEAKHR